MGTFQRLIWCKKTLLSYIGCKESSGGNKEVNGIEIDQEWLFQDFGGLKGDSSYNERDEEDFIRVFMSQNSMFS